MSRYVGDHLSDDLISRLSADVALERSKVAIVICSIDEHGWPHPAMLSTLEVVARDPRNIRIASHVASRTTRNLKANGKLSLILADEQAVFYLKGDALLLAPSMRLVPQYATFNFRVDSVLEDEPMEHENARVVSGIQVERTGIDAQAARSMLDELLAD